MQRNPVLALQTWTTNNAFTPGLLLANEGNMRLSVPVVTP